MRRTIWSRESPLWLWAALLALMLVALIAGAIVAVAATDDDEKAVVVSNPTTTSRVGAVTTPPTFTINPGTTTQPTTTLSTTTTGATTTTATTTTTGGVIGWPANRDGYTVVIKSTPVSQGRDPAEAEGRRAISRGLPQVGVLTSSDYSSLNPGYYVTFTGIYDTEAQAESALPNARSDGYPLAYVRRVAD